MVGLVDLLGAAERAERVPVLGQDVECRALTLHQIAQLLWRFPEVRKLMTGRAPEPAELIAFAPTAVGAVIAAGCGYPGEPEQELAAEKLPFEAQVDLLSAIIRLTAPGGAVPLAEKLTLLMGASASSPRAGRKPASRSPSPSTS